MTGLRICRNCRFPWPEGVRACPSCGCRRSRVERAIPRLPAAQLGVPRAPAAPSGRATPQPSLGLCRACGEALVPAVPATPSGAGQAIGLFVPYVGDFLAALIGPQPLRNRHAVDAAWRPPLDADMVGGVCPRCGVVHLGLNADDLSALRQLGAAAWGQLERPMACGCGHPKATVPGRTAPSLRVRLPPVRGHRWGSWAGAEVRTRACGSCGSVELWVPEARGVQPDEGWRSAAELCGCDCLSPTVAAGAFGPELVLKLPGRTWWGRPRTASVGGYVCSGCGLLTLRAGASEADYTAALVELDQEEREAAWQVSGSARRVNGAPPSPPSTPTPDAVTSSATKRTTS